MSNRAAASRAFTLLELILTVTIISLLVALLLPGLFASRQAARRITTFSNLRTVMVGLDAYALDWRGAFPCIADPRLPMPQRIVYGNDEVFLIGAYFLAPSSWYIVLATPYYNASQSSPVFFDANGRPGDISSSPFFLSCSLFANSAFWNLETRTGPDQFGPTFHHQVRFTSKKTVVYSPYPYTSGVVTTASSTFRVPMAMADSHVIDPPHNQILRGVGSGEGNYTGSWHFGDFYGGAHTVGGVLGLDVP